jgi:ribonuclease P protein component
METFRKEERISGRENIRQLFNEGMSFNCFPFRVYWLDRMFSPGASPARILIAVPKKNLKKATQRNLMKRRIREAYRRNKQGFYEFLARQNKSCSLGVIYTDSALLDYSGVEKKIVIILQRLEKEYEQASR